MNTIKDAPIGRAFARSLQVSEKELEAIRADIGNIHKLIDLMKQDNPELVTDMKRDFSYIG